MDTVPKWLTKIVIPGPPRTWKRVNVVRVNGKTRGVKSAESRRWAHAVGLLGARAMMQIGTPQGWGQRDVAVRIDVYEGTKRRGDLDNYSKGCLDAFNGVLWDDDKQVCKLYVERHYDKAAPRTEVTAWTL